MCVSFYVENWSAELSQQVHVCLFVVSIMMGLGGGVGAHETAWLEVFWGGCVLGLLWVIMWVYGRYDGTVQPNNLGV
jgi:hypothetical protein